MSTSGSSESNLEFRVTWTSQSFSANTIDLITTLMSILLKEFDPLVVHCPEAKLKKLEVLFVKRIKKKTLGIYQFTTKYCIVENGFCLVCPTDCL